MSPGGGAMSVGGAMSPVGGAMSPGGGAMSALAGPVSPPAGPGSPTGGTVSPPACGPVSAGFGSILSGWFTSAMCSPWVGVFYYIRLNLVGYRENVSKICSIAN